MARTKGAKDRQPRKRRGQDDDGESPGIGHNGLTDDQRQAQFFTFLSKLQAADTKIAAAREARSVVVNEIKQAGFLLAEIKTAIQLETDEGETSFKQMLERQLRVARWMGLDPGFQGELFTSTEPDRAYNEGKRAGMKAEQRKPPFAPNTADYEDWMKGYDEGQSLNMDGFRQLDEDNRDLRPTHLRRAEAERNGEDFDGLADVDPNEEFDDDGEEDDEEEAGELTTTH